MVSIDTVLTTLFALSDSVKRSLLLKRKGRPTEWCEGQWAIKDLEILDPGPLTRSEIPGD